MCELEAITLLRAAAALTPEHLFELQGWCLPSDDICAQWPVGTDRVTYLLGEAVSDHTWVPDTADVVLKRGTD